MNEVRGTIIGPVHLTDPESNLNRSVRHCEFCYESEFVDIAAGRSDDLRAMFRTVGDDLLICVECAKAGRHLEDDPIDDDPPESYPEPERPTADDGSPLWD